MQNDLTLVISSFKKLSRKKYCKEGENHETLTNITLRYARLRNSVLESLSVTQQQKQQLGAANATLVHFLCSPKIQSCCPRMSDVHSCCCNAYTHDGRGYRFSSLKREQRLVSSAFRLAERCLQESSLARRFFWSSSLKHTCSVNGAATKRSCWPLPVSRSTRADVIQKNQSIR